jgi:hypothetical protein
LDLSGISTSSAWALLCPFLLGDRLYFRMFLFLVAYYFSLCFFLVVGFFTLLPYVADHFFAISGLFAYRNARCFLDLKGN